MARIVDVKCPKCGAPLPIQPGVGVAPCHYCGARSLLDRGRGPAPLPGAVNPEGLHVVRVTPPAAAGLSVAIALASVLAFAGVAVAVSAASSHRGASTPGSTPLFS